MPRLFPLDFLRRPSCEAILTLFGAMLLTGLATAASPQPPYPTNNDPANQIRFDTAAEADAKRQQLTNWIWSGGLPTDSLPGVSKNIAFPGNLTGITPSLVAGVDRLDADVSALDFHSISYLIHPSNTAKAERLAIVHHGHVNLADRLSAGIGDVTNRLLAEGFTVAVMQMPLCGWNTDNTVKLPGSSMVTIAGTRTDGHDDMFAKLAPPVLNDGGVFRLFLEPVVQNINYFQSMPGGTGDVTMIGLSGGAWTTHLAAAVDTRIKLSLPVAGSAPLYVRNQNGWVGDCEQVYSPLFREDIGPKPDQSGGGVATWLEIYALGGYGDGRRQIMVTNQFEPATLFPGTFPDTFKSIVAGVVDDDLGQGEWQHVYDTSTTQHEISPWAIDNVILPPMKVPEPPTCAITAAGFLSFGVWRCKALRNRVRQWRGRKL